MSVEQLESQVLALPEAERRLFLRWLDAHRHEIFPQEDDPDEEVEREILRRSAELRENPHLAQPVDEHYFERMKQRVADALARKASAV
jgi:hypothetical protein